MRHPDQKEGSRTVLFADNITTNAENPMESTKKLLKEVSLGRLQDIRAIYETQWCISIY